MQATCLLVEVSVRGRLSAKRNKELAPSFLRWRIDSVAITINLMANKKLNQAKNAKKDESDG